MKNVEINKKSIFDDINFHNAKIILDEKYVLNESKVILSKNKKEIKKALKQLKILVEKCAVSEEIKNRYNFKKEELEFIDGELRKIGNRLKEIESDENYERNCSHRIIELLTKSINKMVKPNGIEGDIEFAYYFRGNAYQELGEFKKAINDFSKAIENNLNSKRNEHWLNTFYFQRGKCYTELENFLKSIENFNKAIEHVSSDDNVGEYYVNRSFCYFKLDKFELAINDIKKLKELDFDLYLEWGISNTENYIYELLLNKKVEQERDRIMSNLSHSIKNLIATVIDPLENLQREQTYNSKTIENALRGTSLVRELVNAMNLSYKGTFEDFLFDAKENSGNESMSLEQIILEALKYSVGNMFDGKYFANFMRNYFPSRESFNSGKEAWTKVSQTKDWKELSEFLNKYFFKLEIDLKDSEELVIGNQKGSVMKFTILFQEMLLNAVKYSSFVSNEQREIKISLSQNAKEITFLVANSYKENVQTKSTGLGLEIIKNFAKLLKTTPKVKKEKENYSSSFTFQNLWEN